MTVFDAFPQIDYTYLVVSRGEVYGNRVISEIERRGIFKLRSGMTQASSQETRGSGATLHIHPDDKVALIRFTLDHSTLDGRDVLAEDDTDLAASGDEIVGNGIRYASIDYSIIGMTEGRNFETNEIEHYTLTLERANYAGQNEND